MCVCTDIGMLVRHVFPVELAGPLLQQVRHCRRLRSICTCAAFTFHTCSAQGRATIRSTSSNDSRLSGNSAASMPVYNVRSYRGPEECVD